MAQSDLETANSALFHIGAARIAALGGTSKAAIICNERLPVCKRALLRWHPWNFATKRARISPTFEAITGISDNGGLIQCATADTTTAPGPLANGDRVTIDQFTSNTAANGTWYVENVVTDTSFDLTGSVWSGAPDTGRWTKAAKYEYTYELDLPSDYIRLLRFNDNESAPSWRLEGSKILCNDFPIEIKYTYEVTDYTVMDTTFYEVLALYLAWDICQHLSSDTELRGRLWDEYRGYLAKARFFDSTEDPAEPLEANEWTDSRFTSPYTNSRLGSI